MSSDENIRFGAGGVPYRVQPSHTIEKEKEALEASFKQSKVNQLLTELKQFQLYHLHLYLYLI